MSRLSLALALGAALLLVPGCAAVRGRITADSVKGPVSLTKKVFGSQGEVLTYGRELEKVGQFATDSTFVAAFYGLAPPTWTWDASEFFNAQLDRYGGEAIVDLTIECEEPTGGETLLAYFTQANPMVPIWITVRLSGTVVRQRAGSDR